MGQAANQEVGTEVMQVNASGDGLVGGGNVAAKLMANNMSVNALRTNDVLRKDEWMQYDQAVVDVARVNLRAVGDLITRGLVFPLQNALGTTIIQWEQGSEMTDAQISMSGLADSENDRQTFALKNLPVPIIHKDFHINIRALEASRRIGETLDVTQARLATRLVAERTEKMLFQGASITAGGGSIYGLTTHPSRNTGSLISNWADATVTTGEEIVADVQKMISALVDDNMYGPYILYVPNDYYVRLGGDYKANSDRTILERILSIPGIQAVIPTAYLTGGASGKVVLAQTTSDVLDIVEGFQPTPVMWDSHGGMMINFKVMSILVPRIRSDMNGQCGVAHYSV